MGIACEVPRRLSRRASLRGDRVADLGLVHIDGLHREAEAMTTMALIVASWRMGEVMYLWRTYGGSLVWIGERTHRRWCWTAGWRAYGRHMGWL